MYDIFYDLLFIFPFIQSKMNREQRLAKVYYVIPCSSFFYNEQIHRRPRIGGHQLIGMRTQPQKLIRRCEVTAILVLYGFPR